MKRGRKGIIIFVMMRWIEAHPTKTWKHARRTFSSRSTFQLARRLVKGFKGYARKNYYQSNKKITADAIAAFLLYRDSGFNPDVLKQIFEGFGKNRSRTIVVFNLIDEKYGRLTPHHTDLQTTPWMQERRVNLSRSQISAHKAEES